MKFVFLPFVLISFPLAGFSQSVEKSDSTKATYRADYFYFQTTSDPKHLLSDAAYQAIISAALASGYKPDEIEVTVTATDKTEKLAPSKKQSKSKTRKPKLKKFE
ncbi:MAG: hypothetical protein HGB19_03870 [Chlorobiales bacterium]|jgi:hypothetical protein|nr:hypothetical protein [Chlorobiales bacterium]